MSIFRIERDYQAWLLPRLTAAGAEYFKIVGGPMQKRGWPDVYVASVPWQGFLELKVGLHDLESLQRAVIRKLLERRVDAFVLRHDKGIDYICTVGKTKEEDQIVFASKDGDVRTLLHALRDKPWLVKSTPR